MDKKDDSMLCIGDQGFRPRPGMDYIYALRDPLSMDRRYIGKARDPCDRYRKHLLPYYLKPETHKNRWLRKLLARGQRPWLEIIYEVPPEEDVNQIERDYIRWLGNATRLTNGTLGGDGGVTFTGKRSKPAPPSKMKGVKWRADDPRREQLRMKQKGKIPTNAREAALKVNRKRWIITSPSGERYEVIGLTEFCRAHDLRSAKMSELGRKTPGRTHHKGWHCELAPTPEDANKTSHNE